MNYPQQQPHHLTRTRKELYSLREMDSLAFKTICNLAKTIRDLQRREYAYNPPHGVKGKWNSAKRKLHAAADEWRSLMLFIRDIIEPPQTTKNQRVTRRPH